MSVLSIGAGMPANAVEDLIRQLTRLVEPTPIPLEDWASAVIEPYLMRAKTTRLRMAQALREALAIAGPGATTEALGPVLVARLASRPGATATTAGLLRSLRTAIRVAVGRGWARASVLEGCRFVPTGGTPERRHHHGRAEVARVLELLLQRSGTWAGGRLHAFAALLAYCGLRRNEALRLRWEDLDLSAGFAFVRPNGARLKTRSSAAPVPMPSALVEILGAWVMRAGSEWALPRSDRRGPWTGGTAGRRAGDLLKAAGLEAGVEGFTPHTLRHSLATHLASAWGLTRGQIKLVLRHSTEAMGATYIHDDLVNLRQLVDAFDYRDLTATATSSAATILTPRRSPGPGPGLTLRRY